MASQPVGSQDFLSREFTFPHVAGRRVFVVGVGGGCDIISAFALANVLNARNAAQVVYANTKTRVSERLEKLSPHVLRVPHPVIRLRRGDRTHGTTRIDQSVPRGPDGCPLILHLPRHESGRAELAHELQAISFDLLISVDTGADSIVENATSGMRGRDKRMMDLIKGLECPWFHMAIAPGCDGETTFRQLEEAVTQLDDAGRYRGCFRVDPMVPTMRELAASLDRTRTPNIIVDVMDGNLLATPDGNGLIVPRGCRPAIPQEWLQSVLVIGSSRDK